MSTVINKNINVLVIYYSIDYPLRVSLRDHLYAFKDYSGCRCFYINVAIWRIPSYFFKIKFDLIIFHTSFLSARWTPGYFNKLVQRVGKLKKHRAIKIVMPQDEFYGTSFLNDFIINFDIKHVYSVAPESEWIKIYSQVNRKRTQIYQVLTGYLSPSTVNRINKLRNRRETKSLIDVGYRAWKAEPWLGRHGYLKFEIANIFRKRSSEYDIKIDISTRLEDTFWGDDWYKFLLSCKYTIGVEGGASILDFDGSIRAKTNSYTELHPYASFGEVEEACFPGMDGMLCLFAISPRHLEACATRTCQILVEGDYSHVLEKDKHYIELKRDFSNLDEVLRLIANDKLRKKITEQAYQDVIESGQYDYAKFVDFVLKTSLSPVAEVRQKDKREAGQLIYVRFILLDHLAWMAAAIFGWFKKRLPQNMVNKIKKIIAGI